MTRGTFGESLKAQGLSSLADWTYESGKPGITGLIIDRESNMPGKGYFTLFHKKDSDFMWWADEIAKSKKFDWSPYLPSVLPPVTPTAVDINVPVERVEMTAYRVLRDSVLARTVKAMHNYECQICGLTIDLPTGGRYAEAHHIKQLGKPHDGPDHIGNILCLCPNHHAELDYGVRRLDLQSLRSAKNHVVDPQFIEYHNLNVCQVA